MHERLLFLLFLSAGCSAPAASPVCFNSCVEGESICSGDSVQTCVREGECLSWQTSACLAEQVCRQGACQEISATQHAWADTVQEVIDTIEAQAGLAPDLAVDTAALYRRVESDLFHAEETPIALYRALRQVALAYPIGHLSVYVAAVCGSPAHPFQSTSRMGVCTQPYRDHAVVSFASTGNPLGLTAGDEIISFDGKEAADMMAAALEQPLCGSSSASESNRRYVAATSLFASPTIGSHVKIRHPNGAEEEKTVERTLSPLDCRDPFARKVAGVATSYLRADGIGVIQVPRFHVETTQTDIAQILAEIRGQLVDAFDTVKDAPGIVWDLRANGGGSTLNGLEIVAGTLGAKLNMEIGAYRFRTPGQTSLSDRFAYTLEAGSALPYAGKVAFVTDGLTISAADYTSRAARLASDITLVGAPASGSYGGAVPPVEVGTVTKVQISVDPYRGEDTEGHPIEGQSAMPHIAVELKPQDLARQVDTVLERAVAAVKP